MKNGLVSLLLIFLILFGCSSNSGSIEYSKMYGIWYSELTQSYPDGFSMSIKGTSEYFNNGSCNSIGQYILSIPEEEYTYQITYNIIMTSEWSVKGNSLIEKIVDIKSNPIIFQRGEEKIELRQLSKEKRQEIIHSLPNIQDMIPNGMTSQTEIIDITNERMLLSTPDGKGGGIEYIAQRVETPFQFSQ